jgi:hypothetical protein
VSRRNAEANAEEETVLQQTLVELSGRAAASAAIGIDVD